MELILLDTRTRIRLVLASCTLVGVVACLGHLRTAQAAFPSPPTWWLSQAHCIEHYESGGQVHRSSNPDQRGILQFAYGTWRSVGGVGDPAVASRAEQEYRGWLEWNHIAVDGRAEHWRPWTTASDCEL